MNTLIVTITSLGFFFLINTSKKAVLSHSTLEIWLQKHTRISGYLGLLCLFVAMIFSMMAKGITSGIIFSVVVTMTVGSLIVTLNPLQKTGYKSLCLIFLICLTIEFIIR